MCLCVCYSLRLPFDCTKALCCDITYFCVAVELVNYVRYSISSYGDGLSINIRLFTFLFAFNSFSKAVSSSSDKELFIMFSNYTGIHITPKPWGIHAGVWGLAANFSTVWIVSIRKRSTVLNCRSK